MVINKRRTTILTNIYIANIFTFVRFLVKIVLTITGITPRIVTAKVINPNLHPPVDLFLIVKISINVANAVKITTSINS